MYADYGLAKGLKKYASSAVKAAEDVGQNTITPVLSMGTNVLSGTNRLGLGLQRAAETAGWH